MQMFATSVLSLLTVSLTLTLTLAGAPSASASGPGPGLAGGDGGVADDLDVDGSETMDNLPDAGSSESSGNSYSSYQNSSLNCSLLKMGQYICAEPEISEDTQQAVNCSKKTWTVRVPCYPVKGIYCNGQEHTGHTVAFYQYVACKWTNGKEFSVAVLLSVFLGWLGMDRFYLGYPAIGLLKFCTFGFMFLGHLVDVLLIAIQVVGPSDGSAYVVDYYGAGLTRINRDNFTYIRPPSY